MKPQRTAPRSQRSRGFTLVELLVAITLLAVLSLMAWRGLDGIVHLRERLVHDADDTAALLRALGQWERDLVHRAPDMVLAGLTQTALPAPNVSSPPGSASARVPTTRATPVMPLSVHIDHQRTLALNIVRADPGTPGAWQRVRWWVEDGALRRAVSPPGSTFPLAEPQDDALVLDRIERWSLRGWTRDNGWVELPRSAGSHTPIEGLELALYREAGVPPLRRVVAFR